MNTKILKFKPALLLLIGVALFMYACTQVEDNTRSGSLLAIDSVDGLPGAPNIDAGSPLLSDTCDQTTMELPPPQDPDLCSVTNDNATLHFSNTFLQIGSGSGVHDPSFINDIIVTRYRVDYFRANNRNTPGVDVPFGIDGAMNVRVPINGTADGAIIVVRHVAKREPPLAELDSGTTEDVITANAQIKTFGADISGHTVSATGFLEIHFANFAND
jgi:hypothetical protein